MNKKSLALVFAAAVLGLTACGGEGGGTSANSGKSNAPTSSKAPASSKLPSSSRPPVKAASFDDVSFAAKENKIYLVLTGSASNLEAADIKATVGLMKVGTGSPETTDDEGNVIPAVPATWAIGKETPADADYNLSPTLENKALKLEICLSDIAGLEAGNYTVWAGIKGYMDYAAFGTDIAEKAGGKDTKYRYYSRSDVSGANGLAVVIEELPPIALTEASVIEEGGKLIAKIGGETTKTLDELKAYDSFVNFQNTNGWSNTRVNKRPATSEEEQANAYYYDYVVEGNKAYIKADVSFFTAGGRYNTHLNITENRQINCVLDVSINDVVYTFAERNLKVTVREDITKGQGDGAEYFWGNLGFIVEAIEEAPAEQSGEAQ